LPEGTEKPEKTSGYSVFRTRFEQDASRMQVGSAIAGTNLLGYINIVNERISWCGVAVKSTDLSGVLRMLM
jgi:hypothetical protein